MTGALPRRRPCEHGAEAGVTWLEATPAARWGAARKEPHRQRPCPHLDLARPASRAARELSAAALSARERRWVMAAPANGRRPLPGSRAAHRPGRRLPPRDGLGWQARSPRGGPRRAHGRGAAPVGLGTSGWLSPRQSQNPCSHQAQNPLEGNLQPSQSSRRSTGLDLCKKRGVFKD